MLNLKDLAFFLQAYLDHNSYLIPVGLIGLWRWGVWTFKEIVALKYKPETKPYDATVSIVVPVYNENPSVFRQALETWIAAQPKEIIAVIDYTDINCIRIFKDRSKTAANLTLIVTEKPGKRPALADGIKKASGEIVALVDSDTLWDRDVVRFGLPPFHDKEVAGVATYQNVYQPKTVAQRLFDAQLDLRYHDDYPFLAAAGDALTCLSGRTAFYRRKVILPMLPDLVHETFMGQPVISGDDKRLTYLLLEAGWKVKYQSNSHVTTPGMADLKSYIKQRVRWSRNALRADMRALFQGWAFRYPALAFFQIDKFLQGIVVAISPLYLIVSLVLGLWPAALFIIMWWVISRLVKIYPHFRRRPQDLVIFPVLIVNTFFTGILKIYALFTLNTQGWITRWDVSRLPQLKFFRSALGYGATALLITLIGTTIYFVKLNTYLKPLRNQKQLVVSAFPAARANIAAAIVNPTANNPDLLARRYVVKEGESLSQIAYKFGMDTYAVLAVNASRITNWNSISPGTILTIPGKDSNITPNIRFNYQRLYADPKTIYYDGNTDMINVAGRGQQVTLAEISNQVGTDLLQQTSPKVWLLRSTIYLHNGVTLNLDKSEVTWLKLASSDKKTADLRALNSVIEVNGVKITSWDEKRNDYDRNINNGRSFILVKDESRLDLFNSELAYLGYPRTPNMNVSPYGVSWRMSHGKHNTTILTGEVVNNKFHNNYFGAYTFGATGMLWKGNEFYDNIRYGLDPHDDSNGFLVENNRSHNNGTHGIIFSKRCIYNTIRDNVSYNNGIHGLMLHEKSSNNVVVNNRFYGNRGGGIAIWHSSNNLVRRNLIENDRYGIRANASSVNNLFVRNIIINNSLYGIYLYDKADKNILAANTITGNHAAVYINAAANVLANNRLQDNKVGVYLRDSATNNSITGNYIAYNTFYGLYAKTDNLKKNMSGRNTLWRNRRDVAVYVNSQRFNAANATAPSTISSIHYQNR